MAARRPRFQQRPEPDGAYRLSQVITTYGPGAMVDLVDHAVVVGGLEHWRYLPGKGEAVHEPRLRDEIARLYVARGWRLAEESPFLLPPAGDDASPDLQQGIQVFEFPTWFLCQNPGCRSLTRADALARKGAGYVHRCPDRRDTVTVPVRFVTSCPAGHLSEFPWQWFVHQKLGRRCEAPDLQLQEGATGDFSEIFVHCRSCRSRQPLTLAYSAPMPSCRGERPWLGPAAVEACGETQKLLVRSASYAYHSQHVSALSIEEPGRELHAQVDSVWDVLQGADAATLPAFRTIPKVKKALGTASDARVLAVIEARRRGEAPQRPPLREAEWAQLVTAKDERPGELPGPDDRFFPRRYVPPGGLPPGVKGLVLVSRLRTVQAQVGFTRFQAAPTNAKGELDLAVQMQPLSLTQDWLPASEIHGEGVFLQLDEDAVRDWERRPAVEKRTRRLLAGFNDWKQAKRLDLPFPGARFYLLHSLSHLLISALSLECGYSASALTERIYCSPSGDPVPMAGLLLSTGTPGTEGTLGGLVDEGRRIREHLRHAFRLGRLCSNDPVCAMHSPQADPAERWLEGAACHGCLFIAETSCERFNAYLDRALVVPTLDDPDAAFFRDAP